MNGSEQRNVRGQGRGDSGEVVLGFFLGVAGFVAL